WKGEKPFTIDTLPLRINLERRNKEVSFPTGRPIQVLMGIDDRTLEPAFVDVERQGPHVVILGQPFSSKTTTLRTMILGLAANYDPDDLGIILIDYSKKLWKGIDRSMEELPHVMDVISDIDQLDE